jgi:hypothetical protein
MKNFITQGREELVGLEAAQRAPSNEGDETYMEYDSTEGQPEGSNGSDPNPPSGIHKG